MKKTVRILLLGILTWIVPFIAGFLFFDQTGEMMIDVFLFKSIMIVVGGLIGSVAILIYFKKIDNQFIKHGILIGFTWFIVNILLDGIFLLPMSGMAWSDYFAQIGIRYILIPIMSILCGTLLTIKTQK